MMARLLADGWRPGHEGLFTAARQVFGWDRDSRRLLQIGDLGAWINQAIEESSMFSTQNSDDCSYQTDALLRLREGGKPTTRELISHVPHLRNMVARFPAWTAVIASADQIKQWFTLEQAIPGGRRRLYGHLCGRRQRAPAVALTSGKSSCSSCLFARFLRSSIRLMIRLSMARVSGSQAHRYRGRRRQRTRTRTGVLQAPSICRQARANSILPCRARSCLRKRSRATLPRAVA